MKGRSLGWVEPGEAGVEANGTKGRSLRWVVPGEAEAEACGA